MWYVTLDIYEFILQCSGWECHSEKHKDQIWERTHLCKFCIQSGNLFQFHFFCVSMPWILGFLTGFRVLLYYMSPSFRPSLEVSWCLSIHTKCSTSMDWTWSKNTRAGHWGPCLRKLPWLDGGFKTPILIIRIVACFLVLYHTVCLYAYRCWFCFLLQTSFCHWKCFLWKDDERYRKSSSSYQVRVLA